MANTRETMGEQACLDALVSDTLTAFEDDGVTKVGQRALYRHTSLTSVKLDNCTSVGENGCAACSNLEVVDIKGTGTLDTESFSNTKLKHLVLRGLTKTYGSTSMFTKTPIAFGEGAVYVQSDLVDTYKADSKWRGYTILTISEYPKSGLPETVTDTWAQIAAASQDGTYSSKYDVGDVKSIAIDGTTYYMQLVAKDADVLASDGTTTVPMTWMMFRKLYKTKHKMADVVSGGWSSSDMRSWLSGTVLPLLPQDVQSAIKEVRKYSDTYESGAIAHDQQTSDKLWIPSRRETFGGTSTEQTGPIYSDIFSNQQQRVRYDQSGTSQSWWLRSVANSSKYYMVSDTSGADSYSVPASSLCVCFGFCI